MYERVLIAIDATPADDNVTLQRAETFAAKWNSIVHLLHVGRGHLLPADITGGGGLGVSGRGLSSPEDDVDVHKRGALQAAVDKLWQQGSRPTANWSTRRNMMSPESFCKEPRT